MLIFENSIKSIETRKTYVRHLDKFLKYFEIKDYDELASTSQEKLQIMMEDFVMYLKKIMSPNSINIPIASMKAFFDCNDVELRWSKINRLKPARVKKTGGEAWLTEEVAGAAFDHNILFGRFVTIAKQKGDDRVDMLAYDYNSREIISIEIESKSEQSSHPGQVRYNSEKWIKMGFDSCQIWSKSKQIKDYVTDCDVFVVE